MHWLLAGYCGLALIGISVGQNVYQKPRFYGVKTHRTVGIYCQSSKKHPQPSVEWYKVDKYDKNPLQGEIMQPGHRITIPNRNLTEGSFLFINDLHLEDSGIYFCHLNGELGPGTEIQVAKPVNHSLTKHRSNMKDALIVLQGLLLAVCIAAMLLRKRQLQQEKKDIIYEEPETDHIYEGLTIENCGGGLYEELSVYAQPEGAEAPWE